MEFIDIATEQTTAATDALLALVALASTLYVLRIGWNRDRWKATIWACAFGLLTMASVLGAVAHEFMMSDRVNNLLWQPLNLALGLTIAMFVVGVVNDLVGHRASRRALPIVAAVGVVFCVVTLLIPGTFLVFVIYEAVAMLFALGAYVWLAARGALPGAWWMAAGVLITIVAAAIQASGAVSITVVWPFDYNGVFHLVQLPGVVALVVGLRAALLASDREARG